jgi:hypothetical protein
MKSLLLQFVAIASTFVLSLPPGWCGGFVRHQRVVPALAQTTCCHHTAKDQWSESKHPSGSSRAECCCQWDATVLPKPVQPTKDSALVLSFVVDVPADLGVHDSFETTSILLNLSPRRHVLQCVWRC